MNKQVGKSKSIIKYDKEGAPHSAEICSGDPVPITREYDGPHEDSPGNDLCRVCKEDLFFSSEVTKRIAILGGKDDEVTGWVCPSCFTEFDVKDKILVLMSRSSVQGKA